MFRRLFIALAFVGLALPAPGLALGVSPAIVQVENIMQGSSATGEISISRGNPGLEQLAQVTVTGDGAEYIRLPEGGRVTLPIGLQHVPYFFTIETDGAAPGSYQASINVSPIRQDSEEGSQVLAGATAEVEFSVVQSESGRLEIGEVTLAGEIESQELTLSFSVQNHSNTVEKVPTVELTLRRVDTGERQDIKVQGITQEYDPFFAGNETVQVPAKLDTGLYNADLLWYNDIGQVIAESGRIRFFVEQGPADKADIDTPSTRILIAGLVGLALLGGVWVQRKIKKNNNNTHA